MIDQLIRNLTFISRNKDGTNFYFDWKKTRVPSEPQHTRAINPNPLKFPPPILSLEASAVRLLQNSNSPVGRKVDTPGRRDNNDEVRCPCSRVVGETGEGWSRGGRRKATPSGGGGGYTFEYINVCNSEFVLGWASAILSGGYWPRRPPGERDMPWRAQATLPRSSYLQALIALIS